MTEPRTIAGRYILSGRLGSGGMATVWRARDTNLGRDVAVKLLHPHLAHDDALAERFRREALFAARLAHPNVVAVFDTGTDGGTPFIVMELVGGRTLADVLRTEGPLPVARAARIARGAAEALAHAHEQGLVHRDVKPANVLLTGDDVVHVTDFGISKSLDETALTQTGSMMGTASYISPEQAAGREATPSSDIYALGCVLYECLAGSPPFRGDSPAAVAVQHATAQPPPIRPRRPDVPASVEDALTRALAKDPAQRFPSASAFADALRDTGAEGLTEPVPTAVTAAAAADPDETARIDPAPTQALPPQRRTPRSLGGLLRAAGVALALIAAAWAIAFALTVDRDAPEVSPRPTPDAVTTPAPTPAPTPEASPPPDGDATPCPPALDLPGIGPIGCE